MAYPLLESPVGGVYYYDGKIIEKGSDIESELLKPTDSVTYYETVRIKEGVLLYLEDHLARLAKSVKGIEDFPVDPALIEKTSYGFLREQYPDFKEGNLRIVLTKEHILIHMIICIIDSSLTHLGIPAQTKSILRLDTLVMASAGTSDK